MKNLDLNSYGVQEMNAVEMKETDGGFIFELAAAATIAYVVYYFGENLGKTLKNAGVQL